MKAEETKPKRAAKADGVQVKMGRPTLYNQEMASRIIEEMVKGRSLRSICKEEWCPEVFTVLTWTQRHPEFHEQYRMARSLQAESMFEEMMEIADECEVVTKMDGEEVRMDLSATAVARNKLRVDARRWALARMAPKAYGDKVTQELTGADGGPIDMSLKVSFVKPRGD